MESEREVQRKAEMALLWEQYRCSRTIANRNAIALHLQGLVRFVARRFRDTVQASRDDLVQVANVGLLSAIENYDWSETFTSYAIATMRGHILHYYRDETCAIKAPRRLRELASRVKVFKDRLSQELNRQPTISELASAMGVSEERLVEALELVVLYQPRSLDDIVRSSDKHERMGSTLGAIEPGFEQVERIESLRGAIGKLDRRSREIVERRFYDEQPQTEVASALGISQMHVSRLERQALKQLRGLLS